MFVIPCYLIYSFKSELWFFCLYYDSALALCFSHTTDEHCFVYTYKHIYLFSIASLRHCTKLLLAHFLLHVSFFFLQRHRQSKVRQHAGVSDQIWTLLELLSKTKAYVEFFRTVADILAKEAKDILNGESLIAGTHSFNKLHGFSLVDLFSVCNFEY